MADKKPMNREMIPQHKRMAMGDMPKVPVSKPEKK